MEPIQFVYDGNAFSVPGFPDAKKVIGLHSRDAKQLCHMFLHIGDIDRVIAALKKILAGVDHQTGDMLWIASLTMYFKCYGSSAARNTKLDHRSVFQGIEKDRKLHEYFQHVRNKGIVHDENASTSVMAAALLNDGSKEYKIEKVVTNAMQVSHLFIESVSSLLHLSVLTRDYILKRYDMLTEKIWKELEAYDFKTLDEMPQANISSPTLLNPDKTRSGF